MNYSSDCYKNNNNNNNKKRTLHQALQRQYNISVYDFKW